MSEVLIGSFGIIGIDLGERHAVAKARPGAGGLFYHDSLVVDFVGALVGFGGGVVARAPAQGV